MTHVRRLLFGSGFRRLVVGLAFALMCLRPSRADAWFGFLDYLSGPGPFKGALYDVRLFCFGKSFPYATDLEKAATNALRTTLSATVDTGSAKQAAADWGKVQKLLTDARTQFPVIPAEDAAGVDQSVRSVVSVLGNLPAEATGARQAVPPSFATDALAATEAVLREAQHFRSSNVLQASVGVLLSLCSPNQTRRLSADLNVDFWQANSNPLWASNYSIRLITFMPAITLRLVDSPRYDIVDLGAAFGRYRFSSEGFPPFGGWIAQERLDLHPPTAWLNQGGARQVAALFTGRVSLTNFPGGIAASEFGNPDPSREVSGREWTPGFSVFFDLTPFLRSRSVVPKLSGR